MGGDGCSPSPEIGVRDGQQSAPRESGLLPAVDAGTLVLDAQRQNVAAAADAAGVAVMRRYLLLVLATVGLAWGGRALAQQPAYAGTNADASRRLADESLALMMQAEDEFDDAVRLATYRKGLELARQAVAANDLNPDAHFALFASNGRIMLLEGAAPNPINLFAVNSELGRVLELDPNHADALAARGGLYRQLPRLLGGSLDKARADLSRAIELDPEAVGARMELAQAYRDLGEPARGLPLLETAVQFAEKKGMRRKLTEARRLLQEFKTENR